MGEQKSGRLNVRVQPGAAKNEVAGYAGGVWRVRLQAPPVEGKANAALLKFLAGLLGLRISALTLLHGTTSRSKVIAVEGLGTTEVEARLNAGMQK